MKIRYYIDRETGLPPIYAHGVREEEVAQVLYRAGDDRPAQNGSRMALGQTEAGRYLKVLYSPDSGRRSVFVITAYPLKGKLLAAYRRHLRRRKK